MSKSLSFETSSKVTNSEAKQWKSAKSKVVPVL